MIILSNPKRNIMCHVKRRGITWMNGFIQYSVTKMNVLRTLSPEDSQFINAGVDGSSPSTPENINLEVWQNTRCIICLLIFFLHSCFNSFAVLWLLFFSYVLSLTLAPTLLLTSGTCSIHDSLSQLHCPTSWSSVRLSELRKARRIFPRLPVTPN